MIKKNNESSNHDTRLPITWQNPHREIDFYHWLASLENVHGLDMASVHSASADASFRRYFRINSKVHGTCIVMDAPPEHENCQPFVDIARLVDKAGLRAPLVLDWHAAHGFMLLSDLGTQTMMQGIELHAMSNVNTHPQDTANSPSLVIHPHFGIYMQAVDVLIQWQLATATAPDALPIYNEAILRRELDLFPQWYVQNHRQTTLTTEEQAIWQNATDLLVKNALQVPQVFVHRDFMPRNLMLDLPHANSDADANTGALQTLGVLDFQDALLGPITYDIASLMRDAFLTWDEPFVLDISIRYWKKATQVGLLGKITVQNPTGWGDDFGEFYRAVEWMGLQRHLKILGIFARLTLRDGKPKYLADTPRFINYVRTTCDRYRPLGPLLTVIDRIEGIDVPSQISYAFGRV